MWVTQHSAQGDSQDPFKGSEDNKETAQNHPGSHGVATPRQTGVYFL